MKRIILIVSILFLSLSKMSYAENYSTGVGIRLGGITSGVTLKHFFGNAGAIEGIASIGRHSFLLTGLFEKHSPFPKAEGLSWFFGGGAHVGFFQHDYPYGYFYYYKDHGNKIYVYDKYGDAHNSFGLDFILGMEYKFKGVPIAVSIDAKPFVDVVPGFEGYWEYGFTFRFTM